MFSRLLAGCGRGRFGNGRLAAGQLMPERAPWIVQILLAANSMAQQSRNQKISPRRHEDAKKSFAILRVFVSSW